ncbi:MAG: STAS domain-containing protein [Acidobacteriota bacterium]|nr:STAS domain-containing protein [Acidobacteriota bacterium]
MFEICFRGEDTVVLSGRLDASHEAVAESFLAALDRSMTVDFDELKYIGSNGLGLLFAAQARLLEKGESLKLINLNEHLRYVFRLGGFDTIFQIE